jgi:hypothetical protein
MKRMHIGVAALVVPLACAGSPPASPPAPPRAPSELRAPAAFETITDPKERSRALFAEASRVMLHPRCTNCHPAGDSPAQGDQGLLHDPPVQRGPESKGLPGLECTSCHQEKNVELARVPGAPGWHLAPSEMVWAGRTPHALCEQLKDQRRNGKRTLPQIADHAVHDPLVAWGWAPGSGRNPAPGSQAVFGALMDAWVKTGGECP